MTATRINKPKGRISVDLSGHHALCEMNFHQLVSLLPGMRKGVDSWRFTAGNEASKFSVNVKVIDSAPYTTTLEVEQKHESVDESRIVVRLYHDVSMAEIISWGKHRYWLSEYPYPNPKMYHPDEKLALNQFLGDWLAFCRQQGRKDDNFVMRFS